MSNTTNNVRPFGMRDKIGYMFGDFGNDFTFILSSTFLMKFYTDVMGVSAGIVGLMMMVARIVDAFTDVTMGQIADRSRPTAKGKFLPWIRKSDFPVRVFLSPRSNWSSHCRGRETSRMGILSSLNSSSVKSIRIFDIYISPLVIFLPIIV